MKAIGKIMKQKITLEIENNTGVEFEEVARLGKPSDTDWFVYDGQIMQAKDCIGIYPILTPKIDKELEDAKKLIGKWVKFNDRDVVLRVRHIFRDKFSNNILCFDAIGQYQTLGEYYLKDFTPFPMPVWRCCEKDKPKKDGYYPIRRKDNHKDYDTGFYHAHNNSRWDDLSKDFEWLDEGGE